MFWPVARMLVCGPLLGWPCVKLLALGSSAGPVLG